MEQQREKKIVFAGDSTTDADKLSTPDLIGTGYVRLVRDSLTAFRPWESYRVFNAGVNGHTSRDLLRRWEKDVLSKAPDTVFCMIGINDVWRRLDHTAPSEDLVSPEEYGENLIAMAEKSGDVKDFYFMTPFFMERNPQDEMRAMTQAYADVMCRVAQKYDRPVLDIQAEFDVYMKSRSGLSICGDRVHPASVGALLIARRIMEGVFGCAFRFEAGRETC